MKKYGYKSYHILNLNHEIDITKSWEEHNVVFKI